MPVVDLISVLKVMKLTESIMRNRNWDYLALKDSLFAFIPNRTFSYFLSIYYAVPSKGVKEHSGIFADRTVGVS